MVLMNYFKRQAAIAACLLFCLNSFSQEFKLINTVRTKVDGTLKCNFVKNDKVFNAYIADWDQSHDRIKSLSLISFDSTYCKYITHSIQADNISYILDMVQLNDSIFVLGFDSIFLYIKKGNNYILNYSVPHLGKLDFDKIFLLNNKTLLLANTYNSYIDKRWRKFDKLRFYTLNLTDMKIDGKQKIPSKRDIGMLFSYNSSCQWVDTRNSKIVIADPINLEFKVYTDEFKLTDEVCLKRETSTSTRDSLEKYFSGRFLRKTKYYPKSRIKKLQEIKAFSYERIEKIFFASDDIIGISKTSPTIDKNQRQIIYYSLKMRTILFNQIVEIIDTTNSEVAPNSLIWSYNCRPDQTNKLVSCSSYIIDKDSLGYKFNFYEQPHFKKEVSFNPPNQVSYKDTIYKLLDCKLEDISLKSFDFDFLLFVNPYTCFNCFDYKDKIAIIFIEKEKSSDIGRLSRKEKLEKQFPNSTLFFLKSPVDDKVMDQLLY